ncbi:MAG: hypothetical protein J6A52_01460 [Bacilli bacterium]|nr:hypothetical protein [Bacilli bacterium]
MKEQIIEVRKNNTKDFYKKIRLLKLKRKFGYKFKVKYNGKLYSKDDKYPKEIEEIINIINIINAPSKKEKYSLVYDYACEYLDNEFRGKNLCGFENDICICNRCKPKEKQVGSCCVKTSTGEVCKHFDDINKCCKIKCLGCKLYVCIPLYKSNIKFPVRKVSYLKYFLSFRQKCIVKSNVFVDKEYVLNKLVKFYIWV